MASKSSHSGNRPRRPGERTEKERRSPQDSVPLKGASAPGAGGGSAGRRSAGGQAGRGHGADDQGVPGHHGSAVRHQGGAAQGTTIIYGRNPVGEALRGRRRVHVVWLGPGTPGDDLAETLPAWLESSFGPAPEIRHAAVSQLIAMAGSPDHQGIVAAVDPYPYIEPERLLRERTLLVALDAVQDPHNLGAVIRTAESAGAGVIIPRHRAAEVTAAVVKASAGATEHAAIAQVRNLADFLTAAKEAQFWVYGAAAGAASPYTAQDYRYPTCFVLGSEGRGLSRRVESLCDVLVALPLLGHVGSLNVSVSAGILLYEALRQRPLTDGRP